MKTLTIEVTNRCANSCVHCSSCASFDETDIFLPRHEVIRALADFHDYKKVRFSGGEPFMRPGIINLLHDAKKRDRFVEVLTSGRCAGGPIPEMLIKQCKGLVNNMVFSMYGNDETHFRVNRQVEGYACMDPSVETTIEQRIPFSFVFVAMQPSLAGLEDAFKYVSQRNVDFCTPVLNVFRYIHQGNGVNPECRLALTEDEIKRVRDDCLRLAETYHVKLALGCSLAEEGCNAGIEKMVVTYTGQRFPCSALKFSELSGQFACSERW